MDHNEKASSGSSSLDPTIEVDVEQTSTTESDTNTNSNSKGGNCVRNHKKWWIGASVAALVIFVIVFPTVYVTNQKQNEQQTSTATAADAIDGTTTAATLSAGNGKKKEDKETQEDNSIDATSSSVSPKQLGLFNEDILRGYANRNDFVRDLERAAWFTVEQVIRRNNGVEGYDSVGYGGGMMPGAPDVLMPVEGDNSAGTTAEAGGSSGTSSTTSDFGTNNNAADVEEGDVVVSDGDMVYAAFGSYLLIWNPQTGEMVAEIKMPEVNLENVTSTSTSSSNGNPGMMPVPDMPYFYYPQLEIKSMMLYQGRLLLIVEGHGRALLQNAGITAPIFYDGLNTQLRIYDTASLINGSEEPISVANVQGSCVSARLSKVDGNVHLMTLSGVDMYTPLGMPLERWNNEATMGNMSKKQYANYAEKIANKTLVPQFVDQFLHELRMGDSGFPNLVRLSLFQNDRVDEDAELRMYPNGVVNNLALVHSFNIMGNLGSSELTSAGAFLPSYWAQFYMSLTTLIIAGQGQNINTQTGYVSESTNFLAFGIQGATAVPTSVGSTEGYVVNDRALNVKDNHLRVAVSINNRWLIEPIPLPPVESTTAADTPVSTVPVTVDFNQPDSTTENYMIVLRLPGLNGKDPGVMTETGRVQLGKPNELIQTVRFYPDDIAGDIAYVVTFEQKDPLYMLDMADPKDPKIVGELEMLGFSNYLHRMSNASLLGVGYAADETGATTGTKLTLYNVQNIKEPYIATEYVMKNEEYSYGYCAAVDEPKAGRYVPEANLIAIPFDQSNWATGRHFTGYLTFHSSDTSIVKKCENGLVYNETFFVGANSPPESIVAPPCYYCAFLPPRAMIFKGKLMMMYNHFIGSYDLETCAEQWTMAVAIPQNSTSNSYGCCGQYY